MRACTRKLVVTATAGLLFLATLPTPYVLSAQAPQQEQATAGPPGTETLPDEGRWHMEPGERWEYRSAPPTSGPHDPKWVRPGFYRKIQPPEKLVHSLEHGDVVIYYDRPAPDVRATLQKWAQRHPGKWDGVIVAPLPGLGQGIVLTAWRKLLRLDPFDAARAQAFLDAFRGHGPESGEKDME
ncbi:MAG TPA: DUF3105 domain-containing protein [Geobacteraceae bacterium]|nr:DUF3105 domain-containing protein [Geobacteraceae bacterium]